MDKVRFVVLYGGEWSNSGGKFKYQYEMSKVISVSRETSYESLHDIVSRLVEANPSESSNKMKFIFNSPEVLAPFEVLNDADVQVFLCENSDVNTRTSLCVTIERKRRIIPNTQGPDNELVNEDIANVFESDNDNGVGLDNIYESLLSPNDFQNADVFFIGVDNDDEARDSRPSTSEVPSRRSRVASSQGIGTKSSTIHGSYTSLESVVNNVKEVRVGDLFPSKEELQMKMQLADHALCHVVVQRQRQVEEIPHREEQTHRRKPQHGAAKSSSGTEGEEGIEKGVDWVKSRRGKPPRKERRKWRERRNNSVSRGDRSISMEIPMEMSIEVEI
ncbi:hypothetical protein EZV62_004186 [Acer yangbiense]|uniref:PB1 domain-containing protein n=1 Tax=Acer yangbiense TaxID=1000413 RepID=A0A5C7IJB9_9ROSI|nr:hypothetical protein EZV62_004186 [Acer yangbiense]